MDELTLDSKIYISSKHAAKITGYAKDYVGQLCREGRVEARLVGRSWYVLEESLKEHRFNDKRKGSTLAEEEEVEETKDISADLVDHDAEIPPVPLSKPSDISSNEAIIETPRYIQEDLEPMAISEEVTDPAEDARHLGHMQDAWSEWFRSGGSESREEAVSIVREDQPSEVEERPQEVMVRRVVEAAPPSHMDIEVVATSPTAPYRVEEEDVVMPEPVDRIKHVPESRGEKRGESTNKAVHALFLVIIILSILLTSVITGISDQLIASPSGGPLLDFLQGETRIEK